jgi:hypothetical protein
MPPSEEAGSTAALAAALAASEAAAVHATGAAAFSPQACVCFFSILWRRKFSISSSKLLTFFRPLPAPSPIAGVVLVVGTAGVMFTDLWFRLPAFSISLAFV